MGEIGENSNHRHLHRGKIGDVETGEVGGNYHQSRRLRRKIGEIGEVGEYAWSVRSGNIQNPRLRRFVFGKLRKVLGRAGRGFGFNPKGGTLARMCECVNALRFAHLHIQ